MVSIIVSTYKPNNLENLSKNIELTIGVDYEIIQIHNPGIMSMCKAYNKGIALAQYPYICFCHDDILINSYNWGQRIINLFIENQNLGLIGIAGSSYKPQVPSGWSFPDPEYREFCKMDLYQVNQNTKSFIHHIRNQPIDIDYAEVVTLDGCFMCTTKKVTDEFKFDEKLFTDYHCYDLDYAFQVRSKYKIRVIFGLELIHSSHGSYTKEWIIETFKLHEKWKSKFPLFVSPITKEEICYNEFNAYLFILGKAKENNIYLFKVLKLLYNINLLKVLGYRRWITLQRWTWGAITRSLFN